MKKELTEAGFMLGIALFCSVFSVAGSLILISALQYFFPL